MDHDRDRRKPTFVIGTGLHMINLLEYVVGPIAGVGSERFPTALIIQKRGAEQEIIPGDAGAPRLVNEGFVGEYPSPRR